ncbi:alpha/beta-hydrolase [Terfezia boudieri ATCC MYA-4762]|uniref:Alpha/beta-hydrolase n=1 Tax=Terfezia boudieri ATCC MYA-4762 TaxID=1051890 RepID=A0A3N4M1I4_9PEZI|nr:alpha/beta-hydrolase [Terfezia boudieri ATCC MYA-4762]
MIAPRPVVPVTSSSPAFQHTRAMSTLLRRFLYRESIPGPGREEHIMWPPLSMPQGLGNRMEKRSTLGHRLLSHTAGLLVLYTYALVILVNGGWKLGLSREEKERQGKLGANRASLWALDREPYRGVNHRFYTDKETDHRTHYCESGNTSRDSELVILLHGFPDSYYSYRHQLSSTSLKYAHLVVPDLPGFGGSDSLPNYSPAQVLSTVARFILAMKSKKNHDRCIIVGHDWGAAITCRLASECPKGTFSRAIIINGLHPTVFRNNFTHNLTSFTRTAKSTVFFHHPLHVLFSPSRAKRDLARLTKSWTKNITPILSQARKSHYIFPFRIPWMPLARRLPTMGDYYVLRQVSKMAKCHDEASYLANSLGPGVPECAGANGTGFGYGASVKARKGQELDDMISYYRDGLSFDPWEEKDKPEALRRTPGPHEQLIKEQDAATGQGLGEGRFKCPAIVIWGSKDTFYAPQLVHHGWGKMFCYDIEMGGSATVMLCRSGHWAHVESRGRMVVNGVLEWCVEEGENIKIRRSEEEGDKERRDDLEDHVEGVRELIRLVPIWYGGGESMVNCY